MPIDHDDDRDHDRTDDFGAGIYDDELPPGQDAPGGFADGITDEADGTHHVAGDDDGEDLA